MNYMKSFLITPPPATTDNNNINIALKGLQGALHKYFILFSQQKGRCYQ